MYNSDKLDPKHNLNGNRDCDVGSKGETVKTLKPKADIIFILYGERASAFSFTLGC